jgi:hypothetical protein
MLFELKGTSSLVARLSLLLYCISFLVIRLSSIVLRLSEPHVNKRLLARWSKDRQVKNHKDNDSYTH